MKRLPVNQALCCCGSCFSLPTVFFSRVAGEYATFVINKAVEGKIEKHGVDLTKYEHLLWQKYI